MSSAYLPPSPNYPKASFTCAPAPRTPHMQVRNGDDKRLNLLGAEDLSGPNAMMYKK